MLAVLPLTIASLPFPKPETEHIFPCTGPTDKSCGKEGSCEFNKYKKTDSKDATDVVVDHGTNSTYACVCTARYGTLSIDNAPCTRERASKALAFWLQLFFGALGVGAFVLQWWWYAVSVYVAFALGLVCICSACCCKDSDEKNPYLECASSCISCTFGVVVLVMWIVNFVFIVTDCYSVLDVNGKEYSLKCWENL